MRWLVVAIVLLGCKGKPKHRPPPANLTTGAATPGSAAATAPDIVIPSGNGKPPIATTAPLSAPEQIRLQQRAYKGFQNIPHAIGPRGTELAYLTEDRPKIQTVITVAPCTKDAVLGECTPMNLDAWKAKTEELKKLLPKELRVASDTKFEVGTTVVNATPLIYTFQLGQTSGVLTEGSAAGTKYTVFSYAYTVYYNDGHNQIRVISEYKDQQLATVKDMIAQVPREDLEATAQGFWDATTQAW
ncbi:MAG TPA: hypothetical protein VGC41_09810 [Kofleriaceae bacterium]